MRREGGRVGWNLVREVVRGEVERLEREHCGSRGCRRRAFVHGCCEAHAARGATGSEEEHTLYERPDWGAGVAPRGPEAIIGIGVTGD